MHTFTGLTTGLQTLGIVRWASASVPLARFVRWKLTASSAWNVTFRLWINANQAGGR
jgi:hypothetical protein